MMFILLIGCTADPDSVPEAVPPEELPEAAAEQSVMGVWISHTELKAMFQSEAGFQEAFSAAADRCAAFGLTDLFVQVRPFCDALYASQLFPMPDYAADGGFDPLSYMIEQAHSAGMRLHAWINPYRVLSKGTLSDIPSDSPARSLPDGSVGEAAGGVYLKASSNEAVRLVLDGVREIVGNYEVDGIHIDDYFYPTGEEGFDRELYEAYCAQTDYPLALDDWRRSNVNALVSGISSICRSQGVRFGVSPGADNNKNYQTLYADIGYWCETGLCDYIAPQLYFGFEYPTEKFRFDRLLAEWTAFARQYGTALYIGLASYKIGTEQAPDCDEWNRYDDILARQAERIWEEKAGGMLFFSYSSLFSDAERNRTERENLYSALMKSKGD